MVERYKRGLQRSPQMLHTPITSRAESPSGKQGPRTQGKVRTSRARDGQRAWSPRAIIVEGRCTSLRLEPIIWDSLNDIAAQHNTTVNEVVSRINRTRDPRDNLSAAIRIYTLSNSTVSEPQSRRRGL